MRKFLLSPWPLFFAIFSIWLFGYVLVVAAPVKDPPIEDPVRINLDPAVHRYIIATPPSHPVIMPRKLGESGYYSFGVGLETVTPPETLREQHARILEKLAEDLPADHRYVALLGAARIRNVQESPRQQK